jgi:cell wall-associated NlpC family hydrolase
MLQRLRTFLLFFCLIGANLAFAAPQDAADESSLAVGSRVILEHVDQVRQVVSTQASDLVSNAFGFLGVPYKRGGASAETGFDCSGFVQKLYEQTVGLILPRKASQQAAATQRINKADLQPGDLVFFNTMRRAFSHVGIYIGDGQFIHAPRPGAEVRVENMGLAYWKRRFDGARRVEVEPTDSSPQAVITEQKK